MASSAIVDLTAYYPKTTGGEYAAPIRCELEFGNAGPYGDAYLNCVVCAYPDTNVSSTIGDVTISIRNMPDSPTVGAGWKAGNVTYGHDYGAGYGYYRIVPGSYPQAPCRSTPYDVTVDIVYEVAYNNPPGKLQCSADKRRASESVTLTVPSLPTYMVSYDANGGSGAPPSQQKMYGQPLTLSTTKPTRTGYEFGGWTGSDGNEYQPGDTYTTNSSLSLTAIWGGQIMFVGNGGGNIPKPIAKPVNEAVTLPDNIPTKAGYIFLYWNTSSTGNGTKYYPKSIIPASMNGSLTLYAIWEKGPDAPTIQKLTVIRCNSGGTPLDDGTYCSVTCNWSIDTVNVSNNNGRVTGVITQERGEPKSFAFISGYTGTQGSATALRANVDTDKQYTITVTVTDKNYSTDLSAILTRAKFILDFKAGGLGLGIGSAAPTTGVGIGWDVQFDGNVKINGTLDAAAVAYRKSTYTDTTTPPCTDMFNPNGMFSSDRVVVQRFGRLVQLNFRLATPDAASVPAGSTHDAGVVKTSLCPSETATFASEHVCGCITTGGSVRITVISPWSGSTDISAVYMTMG